MLEIRRLPVRALIAVGVLIGATACTTTNVSGSASNGSTGTPTQTTPSVSPQDLDPSTYQSLTPREYALLIKDPDAHKGRKIIVYGVVTQFDTATGKSELRANTGTQPGDYSENTMIDAKDPAILTNVVKGDAVTMWCEVRGSTTYDTTNNAHLTVPQFWVYIVKDAGAYDSNS